VSEIAEPVFRRINRGKGHSYTVDGEPVDGTTKIIDGGFPKPGLINWAADVTRRCVMDRWADLAEMLPSERDEVLRRARWDHRDEAADRGKQAHDLIMRHARGEEVEPPEPLDGYFRAYEQFVDEWRPRELLIEASVLSTEYRYAGTLDVVADLADGRRWLLDYKTGGKGIFREFALQLAAYRYADYVVGADGRLEPMPRVDRTGCVWIQDGLYELVPVAAGPEAFETFGHVQAVAAFANGDRGDVVGETLRPPPLEEG
jgi:hypothetical protein